MPHHCQALVFRCMDFRIKPTALADLLAEAGYPEGSYDLSSSAGAAKDLLSVQPGEKNFLLKQIELSTNLHGIAEVVILYHDNCGAYGIADSNEEHLTQARDLAAIKSLLAEKFPNLAVKIFIIKGTPTGELRLEKIG